MKPEQQGIIISNYKLTELYSILADDKSYDKYINDLFALTNEYIKRAGALSALHTEAFLQSMKKPEEVNAVDSMGKAYDQLSETDQKQFCKDMLGKKEFFQDAYKVMMDSFEKAVKMQKDDVVSEKMKEQVEK